MPGKNKSKSSNQLLPGRGCKLRKFSSPGEGNWHKRAISIWGYVDLKLLAGRLLPGVTVFDWTKFPDLAAVALLTCAFASVARRGQTPISRLWLVGWELIALHFGALIFAPVPGLVGALAGDISLIALVDAGVLFMYASVPYRDERSSRLMLIGLLTTNSIYVSLLCVSPAADFALTPVAVLFSALPLAVALLSLPAFQHFLRWAVV